MNEGINNDMQKVSLANLLESKKVEISQKKADEQKEIKDNLLEDAMNEVDDKRTEIVNLSEKKTNLTEKQDNLSESLNSIKDSVKVFKESKQNLKDLYQKAKSDSDLEAFLKENGIESWEDLIKSEEFAKTDEVSSFSKAKEDIKKSVEGRKSQEEKVREEYGLDDSFKGTKLEGKISEEKTKVESNIKELKMETPEGQKEIKDEAKENLEKKMDSWFDEQIKPFFDKSLETGNFRIFKDFNLINEEIDLSEKAKESNKTPEELWKEFYKQKVKEIGDSFKEKYDGTYRGYSSSSDSDRRVKVLDRIVDQKIKREILGTEQTQIWNSDEFKNGRKKQDEEYKILGFERENHSLFSGLELTMRGEKIDGEVGVSFGYEVEIIDGEVKIKIGYKQEKWIENSKSQLSNVDEQIKIIRERKDSRGLFQGKLKKEDEQALVKLAESKKNIEDQIVKQENFLNQSKAKNKQIIDSAIKKIKDLNLTEEELREYSKDFYERGSNKLREIADKRGHLSREERVLINRNEQLGYSIKSTDDTLEKLYSGYFS